MADVTVTYSKRLNGWTSFFTFYPEWMIGLNRNFYSMKAGDLYRHRDTVVNRNTFYLDYWTTLGTPALAYGDSTITNVFNDAPLDAKMFKTVGLEGTEPWAAAITTDLTTGQIATAWFVAKEGDYYANIRRDSGNTDLDLMSAQGIGACLTVVGAAPTTINFAFTINPMVNVGDTAYKQGAALADPPIAIGPITAKTATSITITTVASLPVATDVILAIKDAEIESYGSRGYYMEIQLTNSLTTQVELFSISSEAFKSYP